jgi:hypothetical protein
MQELCGLICIKILSKLFNVGLSNVFQLFLDTPVNHIFRTMIHRTLMLKVKCSNENIIRLKQNFYLKPCS